jgi:hypothetical protein
MSSVFVKEKREIINTIIEYCVRKFKARGRG